jgi:hypothetical protein
VKVLGWLVSYKCLKKMKGMLLRPRDMIYYKSKYRAMFHDDVYGCNYVNNFLK